MKRITVNWKILIIKLIIIAIILSLDMVTKVYFAKHSDTTTFLPGFISFVYTENTGAAFGMFSNHQVVLVIISVLFIVLFSVWDILNKDKNLWAEIGYACVVGGAIGNLIDRLAFGYVRDFVNFDFMTWGIFNLADAFITIGCVLYVIYFITESIHQKKEQNNGTKE